MPKIKTHRGLAKRVKVTARGKVLHSRAYKSHLMSGKSAKRRRHLRKKCLVHETQAKKVKHLLGQ
ncbi:MAG TPA: 50S ribosomal protein L35 [Candidatus Hypogeohydataceae bacterium YC41]